MSAVWKHFTKLNSNESQCNICLKQLKSGGGTTNLRQHLNSKHPHFKDETSKKRKAVNPESHESSESRDSFFASPSAPSASSPVASNVVRSRSPITSPSLTKSPTSAPSCSLTRSPISSPAQSMMPKRRQITLFQAADRTASFEKGGKRDVEITNALIYMVCKDNAPHSIVESEGFMHYTKTTAPLYKLPSRNTVTKMISSRYIASINLIKNKVAHIQHFSLTADICTVINTSRSFLVVTGHFICPDDFILETIMLGVRRLSQSHDGDYISYKIEDVLESFQIPKSKIVSICTDGGSNMGAAVKKLLGDGKNVYCLAHLLNLTVTDGLDDVNNLKLKELIVEVKKIVTFARQSNLFMDQFRAEQQKEGTAEGNVLLLVQSVPTRWNSTYLMLQRFIDLSPYVARVLANPLLKKAPRMISGSDIEILLELIKILGPFFEATKEISGSEYITGSLVIPLISCIQTALAKITVTNAISKMLLLKVTASLTARSTEKILGKPLLCLATIADPRFKRLYMSPSIASKAISQLSEEVKQRLKELGKCSSVSAIPGCSVSGANNLWSAHDENRTNSASSLYNPTEENFSSELKIYLQQPELLRSSNPLEFWKHSKGCMPALAETSLKYLTVIGSSVASERLVSSVNAVVSDERSRLTDLHITERVFMNRINKKYLVE